MKKIYCLLALLSVLGCFLFGCSNNDKKTAKELPIRAYVLQQSDELIKPTIMLKENNEFQFSYSVLSSYIPIGLYEIKSDELFLRTDDKKYEYIFEIKNDTLVFNAEKSSSIPGLAKVMDRTIFE